MTCDPNQLYPHICYHQIHKASSPRIKVRIEKKKNHHQVLVSILESGWASLLLLLLLPDWIPTQKWSFQFWTQNLGHHIWNGKKERFLLFNHNFFCCVTHWCITFLTIFSRKRTWKNSWHFVSSCIYSRTPFILTSFCQKCRNFFSSKHNWQILYFCLMGNRIFMKEIKFCFTVFWRKNIKECVASLLLP